MARGVKLLLLACVVLGAGCEKPAPQNKPVYPVHGSAVFNGKPPVGATVIFNPLPLDRMATPSRGMVKADGSFQLSTYGSEDGAPEGEYAVTLYWPGKRTGKKAESEDEEIPPDQLGNRYFDAASSKIKVQVKAGENKLEPFQLR